jgi:aquaporin Z
METLTTTTESPAVAASQQHWPEYLMEAAELACFMISACVFTVLLQHPASPIRTALPNETLRRVLTGIAMGLTAISIFHSPWGKRSGAHLNPSVTLTFYSLGKIQGRDALFYILGQFAGGVGGVGVASLLMGAALRHPTVNYAATMPGPNGPRVAFGAEFAISFLMITAVLTFSNSKRLNRWTPLVASTLVATYISIEAPLSGMSMNPARTLGSSVWAASFQALWVYFTAPVLGMLLAARIYVSRHGAHRVFCAKLHHHNDQRCIFRCNYGALN